MATSVEHLPPETTADAVAEALARDGAVVIDDVDRDGVLDRVRDEMQPYIDVTVTGQDGFAGRRTRRTGGLIARSPASHELIQHPLVLATVAKVLGHSLTHHLHLTQVIDIGPGEPAQAVHRDQWAFDFFPFPKGYDVQCNTIWAMTDFTDANGATRVVPGSHLLEDKLQFGLDDTVPAEMSKGSVLVYNGAVYHGGGPNRSDAHRLGLNITYAVGWLRQEENQYLTVPREQARELPDDLLRLMGYARGAYALGYVDDLRDPLAALRDDETQQGFGRSDEIARGLQDEGRPGGEPAAARAKPE
jgi:ectoine hydroxylase-related dioxygenase (phytanoyl-CoA dioxygenase family)